MGCISMLKKFVMRSSGKEDLTEDRVMLSCHFLELRAIVIIQVTIKLYKVINVDVVVIQISPD